MKQYAAEFMKRGLMASAGGPVVVVIVYKILKECGVMSVMPVDEVFLGVLTSVLLAFVAGGVSVVYQIEKLPILLATLIHLAVLFADYLIIYFVNGWIDTGKILLFTGIFVVGYAVIWLIVMAGVKAKVKKLNQKLGGW